MEAANDAVEEFMGAISDIGEEEEREEEQQDFIGETEETQAIKPTKCGPDDDPEKVVAINQDKLVNVKDEVITEACEAMQEIDDQRADLNAEANAIRAKLKHLGIPTEAFNAAYSRFKLGDRKRAEMDAAFAKCAKAMGVGYQGGLF